MSKYTFFLFVVGAALLVDAGAKADSHNDGIASANMLADTCVACHGGNGHSAGPAIPSIAGLSFNYFVGTMLSYKHSDDAQKIAAAIKADPELKGVKIFRRYGTVMPRIAKGYTIAEIKRMAKIFEQAELMSAMQKTNPSLVEDGKLIHEKYCQTCHTGNASAADSDSGILAGQWERYLTYVLEDQEQGRTEVPKAMKKAINNVRKERGEKGVESLIQYYASIQTEGSGE